MRNPLFTAAQLLAGAGGFAAGFDFAGSLGGPLAGVFVGLIAAAFAVLMVSGAADLWRRVTQ